MSEFYWVCSRSGIIYLIIILLIETLDQHIKMVLTFDSLTLCVVVWTIQGRSDQRETLWQSLQLTRHLPTFIYHSVKWMSGTCFWKIHDIILSAFRCNLRQLKCLTLVRNNVTCQCIQCVRVHTCVCVQCMMHLSHLCLLMVLQDVFCQYTFFYGHVCGNS